MTTSRTPSVILALNAGSSSLKFGLYRMESTGTAAEPIISGEAASIGEAGGTFTLQDASGSRKNRDQTRFATHADALARVIHCLEDGAWPAPEAIGHRVVHGGIHCRDHSLIDDGLLQHLKQAAFLAPLHVPLALSVIRAAQKEFPGLAQVACLDTAFHRTLPDVARVLPLPESVRAEGIERYGFHGLSCESIIRQLGADVPERLVIAHLGNGASVTAVRGGLSVDTSMGLTPSGGMVMGTRTGDIDPGVLLYLMRAKGLMPAQIGELIEHRSGLIGISGVSHDMRRLHEVAATNPDAALAIELFCASARKQIGAMATVLKGIDQIVFTGGIGEHDSIVRDRICDGLANGIRARVMRSEENEQICLHTKRLAVRLPAP